MRSDCATANCHSLNSYSNWLATGSTRSTACLCVDAQELLACMYLYNFAGSTGDQHFLQVAYLSLSTSSRVQAGSQRQGSKRTRQSVYCAPRLLADADEETQQADLAVWSSAARCVPPYLPAAARGAAWPAEEVADALMAERADDTEVGAAHSDSEGLPRLLRDLREQRRCTAPQRSSWPGTASWRRACASCRQRCSP
jgi:hypothetical protein